MSDKTLIEWTGTTLNVVTGCTKISEGCTNCYIERTPPFRMNGRRFSHPGVGGTIPPILHPDRLSWPLRWREPRTVFVCSLADLFHRDVPDSFIAALWATMARTPQHTYQILSKRAGRLHHLLGKDGQRLLEATTDEETARAIYDAPWPLPNVHVGVSVESQRWADIRIPLLADPEVKAAVKFLSVEPLIGPVDLRLGAHVGHESDQGFDGWTRICLECSTEDREVRWFPEGEPSPITWLIVGGESGPGARPVEVEWIRSVVRQAQGSGVPAFVKQMGSAWAKSAGAAHHKGGDPHEWPGDLRVREMPRVVEAVA